VTTSTRVSKAIRALQVSAGYFFEAFDLVVFGTFAKVIGDNFFPSGDEQLSQMLALATFASAYLMRFVGALVLGPYFDHAGRRKGLIVSLSLMSIGTAVMALTPTYRSIGLLAPVLLITARLVQGFAMGSETGGVTAYLFEIAPKERRALFVSLNTTTFYIATLAALSLGYALNRYMTPADLAAWGWRIPLLIGCGIIPLVFYFRRRLLETEAFEAQSNHPTMLEALVTVAKNWRMALAGMFMIVVGSTIDYFMITFMPVYGKDHLGLTAQSGLLATVIAMLWSLAILPVFAILSDKFGRFRMLSTTAALVLLTAYPVLYYLIKVPSYANLILCQLWFGTLYSAYASSCFVALSELVPARTRATGYGVSTTLGLAIFGGFTPLVSTWLIRVTGNVAAPAYWLCLVATLGLLATVALYRSRLVSGIVPASVN
jgi:MHS family citrate/tricarballylate:H+ symporter-like MFS transporter